MCASIGDGGIRRERDLENMASMLRCENGLDLAAQDGDEVACPGLDDAEAVLRDLDAVLPALARPRAVVIDVQADRIAFVVARAAETQGGHREMQLEPRSARARRPEARQQLAQGSVCEAQVDQDVVGGR